MKKINYKKILITVLWIIALSGLATSLAFIEKKEKLVKVENLNIIIHENGENQFVDEEDIIDFFNARKDSILNSELQNVNVNQLEKILNSHPAVENADLSVDINGDVKVDVKQRIPLVRVINMDGESYYLDNKSELMPLSDKYTARVLIANGFISEPYARRYSFSAQEIGENEIFKEVSVLDDIYEMANYISNDSLLSALIHQVSLDANKEFELYPALGGHKILFGKAIDIQEKFENLKVFYKEGLNKTDKWNNYSTINLKYKNQVVCTKK
jgi:cell division protein FtsQ